MTFAIGRSRGIGLQLAVLKEELFPNGKLWFFYPSRVDKRSAYIVHANWVRTSKKTRLVRDDLWFLDGDDEGCEADFDPLSNDCSHLCVPVAWVSSGKNFTKSMRTCDSLNRDDDRMALKFGEEAAKHDGRMRDPRGLLWHPHAYAALGCAQYP